MLCSYHDVKEGFRNVSLRIYNVKKENIPEIVKRIKEKTPFLYLVDYIDNKRELY